MDEQKWGEFKSILHVEMMGLRHELNNEKSV